MSPLLLVTAAFVGCTGNQPDGVVDLSEMPDAALLADLDVPPDQAVPTDLAAPIDLVAVQDLSIPPDLTPASDMNGPPRDLAARPEDLARPTDLVPPPDLARPDLATPPDLARPPDLLRLPDLAAPPDLAGPGCSLGGSPILFAWPLSGMDARDWVINNYVDLDPSPGLRDYSGAVGASARTYDGHNGIDIDVPSFRSMDNNTAVLAAAPGTVSAIEQAQPDRNTSCINQNWNYVVLRHDDGSEAWYGHLKRNSVVVMVGQRVASGAKLGVVGSSGCSTAPHLHFELHDTKGNVVEPFLARCWANPPVYATPLGIMETQLRASFYSKVEEIKDPLPDIATIAAKGTLGLGLSVGGGLAGATITLQLLRPDASEYYKGNIVFPMAYRHSYWWWNLNLDSSLGVWRANYTANGQLVATRSFTMQ